MRQLLSFLLFVPLWLNAQVTTEPNFPSADEEIRIIYDATQGTSGLQGASKVYIHAGVILDSPTGSGWENVVGNWGQDDGIGELTQVTGEANKWEITITPRSYFSVADGVDIYRLGMVFRNADGSAEGKSASNQDIFIEINNGQFSLSVDSPTNNYKFYDVTETIDVIAKTSDVATINYYLDGNLITSGINVSQLSTSHDIIIDGQVHVIKITATNGTDIIEKSYSYTSTPTTPSATMPQGVLKGINYSGNNTSVTLVLEAPNKQNVFVLGDFNNWLIDNNYLMNQDGELFWLTINNLTPNQPYVFQYLIDGEILIADPYTDQVSDPWDDKHIEDSRYSNLIPYPEGKTEYRASVFETGQTPFTWTISDFQAPPKEDLVIYELLVRDFDEKRTYNAVIDKLDYLQILGINALELMPVNEFEGNLSWGYNPNFYFAPDKYYGHKNDLKKLIDECHKRGIAVIIDLVLNHSFHSSPLVRMYQSSNGKPAADNPWYNVDHNFQNTAAHWGADFNHESSYTQDLVDSVNHYWMSEYKVDGFRFDFTKGFGNRIKSSNDEWGSLYDGDRIRLLKRMADAIWQNKANAYVAFEHLAENSEEQELADYGILLWGNMNHPYRNLAKGNSTSIALSYHDLRGWRDPNLVGYMESHDEERVAWDAFKTFDKTQVMQRLKLNAAFFFTIPGPKMIWQFEELGYDEELNNDRLAIKPTHWEYLDDPERKELFDVYSSLIKLHTQTDYFKDDYFKWSSGSAAKWIQITHPDVHIAIVGNFSKSATLVNARFTKNGTWYNYFSGETIEVTDFENHEFILSEGDFRIFTSEVIENNVSGNPANFISGFGTTINEKSFKIYPNPVRNKLIIDDLDQGVYVKILDARGVIVFNAALEQNQIDLKELNPGFYIIELKNSRGEKLQTRFIKEH